MRACAHTPSRLSFPALLLISFVFAACGEVEQVEGDLASADTASIEGSQPELRQAPARPRTERPPAAGSVAERVEDAMLETRVLLALRDDNLLGHYPFIVEARDGRVFVQGDVESEAHRERITQVADAVDGVEGVINEVVSPEPRVADAAPVTADTSGEDEQPAADEAPASESSATYHTVRSGESLWTIARQYQTSVDAIQRLNNMSSNSLRPGQRLRVR